MKTKKLLILFLFVYTQSVLGQTITFQKSFSQVVDPNCTIACEPYAIAFDIKETYDSGYIVTGAGGFALMRLDKNGDTTWVNNFFSGPPLEGNSVIQTCDSGYITAGSGMLKTDRNGNLLWSKYYPAAGYQSHITKTNDCEYILGSTTNSFGAGGNDIYVIKTDTGGNPLWSKTYGGTGDDEATAIQQTADGGYIIAGYTNSFDTSGYNAYLIKTDENGDTLWTKSYHNGQYTTGGVSSIQQTYDHGYIMIGYYIIKTDSIGKVMWSTTYGQTGYYIHQTLDSGYIFLSSLNTIDGTDLLLIKINKSGNLLWTRDFPGPPQGYRVGITVLQTSDGGYVVNDYTHSTDNLYPAVYMDLIKTDASGQSGCNESNTTIVISPTTITASGTPTVVTSPLTTVADSLVYSGAGSIGIYTACTTLGILESRIENSSTVYPNPVSQNGSLNIFLDEDLKGADVSIFNTMGEMIYSEKANSNGRTILLSLQGRMSAGIYFLRITQNGNMDVKKIVVM